MNQDERRAAIAAELESDPTGAGYLAVQSDAPEWNVFNMLRDPARARLAAIGVDESAMTIHDVRAAMGLPPVAEGA